MGERVMAQDSSLSQKAMEISSHVSGEYLVVAVVVALLIIGVLIYLFVKKEKQKPQTEVGRSHKFDLPPYLSRLGLGLIKKGYINVSEESGSFVKFYEKIVEIYGRKGIYSIPWYGVVGANAQDLESLMRSIGEGPLLDEGGEGFRFVAFRNFALICCQLDNPFETQDTTVDHTWQKLFTLLMRYRPAMPLNGVVWHLSLLPFCSKDSQKESSFSQSAAQAGQFFARMQANLSVQLPVYVLFGRSDVLSGFSDMCKIIPEGKEQNMLGWSSPYPLEEEMTAHKIDDLFEKLYHQLHDVINKLFCNNADADIAMGTLVYPHAFKELRNVLLVYLRAAFGDSRLQKPPFLRGIYITGYAPFREIKQHKSEIKIDAHEKENQRMLFFVRDLFSKKIALEGCLVRPQEIGVSRLNKAVGVTKVSCICVGILAITSLWVGINHTVKTRAVVRPSLEKLSNLLMSMNQVQGEKVGYSQDFYKSYAEDTLKLIRTVQSSSFINWFYPPSWFGRVNLEVEKQLQLAYQSAILKTIYIDLLLKLKKMLTISQDIQATHDLSDLLNPYEGKDFLFLKKYVEDFKTLLSYIDRFNQLGKSVDVKDLQALTQFVFKSDLPEAFTHDFLMIYSVVKKMRYPKIDVYAYQDEAHKRILTLFNYFASFLFDSRNVNGLPAQLNSAFKTLAVGDTSVGALNNLFQWQNQLKALIQRTNQDKNVAKNPFLWMDGSVNFFNKKLNQLINSIALIPIFGEAITIPIQKNLKAGLKSMQSTMVRIKTAHKSFFVKNDSHDVSHILLELNDVLQNFFKPTFMRALTNTKLDQKQSGLIFWDDRHVKEADDLIAAYRQNQGEFQKEIPLDYQASMDNIAQFLLRSAVIDELVHSQYTVLEKLNQSNSQQNQADFKVAQGFSTVLPSLLTVLDMLNQYQDSTDDFKVLHGQIMQACQWLLKKAEDAFVKQSPYAINQQAIINWDGAPGLALQMFQQSDAGALQKYLNRQFQLIERLSETFIAPVVKVSEHQNMGNQDFFDDQTFLKWKGISEQVEEKKKQISTNTVDQLYGFITGKLNRLGADKMFDMWQSGKQLSPSSDFFLNQMMKLKAQAMAYAEVFVRQRSLENYQQLAKEFNDNLAGKFPFAQAGAEQLDLSKLAQFFTLFDQMGGTSQSILEGVESLPQAKNETVFINNIQEVRHFMASYLDDPYASTLTLQTLWQFRVNRKDEQNASDVVDVSCVINDETTLDSVLGVLQGSWQSGQTLKINFRWPDIRPGFNPRQPLVDATQPSMTVSGALATFNYQGKWALLDMIQNHLVLGSKAQDGSYLFKFIIPTSDNKKTIIYNRMTLRMPSKNTKTPGKLVVIPTFPKMAPLIAEQIIAEKDQPILTRKTLAYDVNDTNKKAIDIGNRKGKTIKVDVSQSDDSSPQKPASQDEDTDSLFEDAS